MKRNIFYVILILVFFTSSCKKDYDTEYRKFGADLVVTTGMTSLDDVLKVNVTTFGIAEPIAVTHLGGTLANGTKLLPAQYTTDLGSIPIADDKGVLSISETLLGPNAIGTSFNLKLLYKNDNGDTLFKKFTAKIADPLKITLPSKAVVQDTNKYDVSFAYTPVTSALSNITVEKKVSKAGTYTPFTGPFAASGKVTIKGNDYQPKDTVFFRFSATGGHVLSRVSSVVVGIWSYSSKASLKLELAPSDTMSMDLLKRILVKDAIAGDSADIKCTVADSLGGYGLGFIANNAAEFLKYPAGSAANKVYSEANRVTIAAADYSSAIKSDDFVAVGDVFVFRTKRGTGAYKYGVFKVTTLVKPNAVQVNSYFEFELKY